MHTTNTKHFATKTEADAYIAKVKADADPSADIKITDYFHDDDVVFAKMPWSNQGRKYYVVIVDSYY